MAPISSGNNSCGPTSIRKDTPGRGPSARHRLCQTKVLRSRLLRMIFVVLLIFTIHRSATVQEKYNEYYLYEQIRYMDARPQILNILRPFSNHSAGCICLGVQQNTRSLGGRGVRIRREG
jgi:hypothetical protein